MYKGNYYVTSQWINPNVLSMGRERKKESESERKAQASVDSTRGSSSPQESWRVMSEGAANPCPHLVVVEPMNFIMQCCDCPSVQKEGSILNSC